MQSNRRAPSLRLLDYYLIEGVSSFAATIFLLSLFFWTRARFDFSNTENLLLGVVQGAAHMVAARLGGRWSDRWGYTRIILAGLAGTCAVSALGWLPEHRATPFVVITAYAALLGLTWPALEGGAMHMPGRINMPRRLGLYNLVWSFCGAIGFFLSGFVFAWRVDAIFWIPAGLHALQVAWILFQRGRHAIEGEAAMQFPHMGDRQPVAVKRRLMRLALLSNSVGYFLAGGFSALTPHLGERLGLTPSWAIWLGSSLLAARAAGFVILYRWHGWHYHAGWSAYALWSAPVWLAVIFFTTEVWLAAGACLLLGFSLGLSYYMSIYYALDAGDNKGEQGGLHEMIIGIGILAGPLAGAAGGHVFGSTLGAKATIVILALLITAIGQTALNRINR